MTDEQPPKPDTEQLAHFIEVQRYILWPETSKDTMFVLTFSRLDQALRTSIILNLSAQVQQRRR